MIEHSSQGIQGGCAILQCCMFSPWTMENIMIFLYLRGAVTTRYTTIVAEVVFYLMVVMSMILPTTKSTTAPKYGKIQFPMIFP